MLFNMPCKYINPTMTYNFRHGPNIAIMLFVECLNRHKDACTREEVVSNRATEQVWHSVRYAIVLQ